MKTSALAAGLLRLVPILAAGLFCVGAPRARAATQLYATLGNGSVETFAADGTASVYASGFSTPEGLTFDSSGNLYVVNAATGDITKVTPAGVRSTVYNEPTIPRGLTSDAAGNLYLASTFVRKIAPNGTVTTYNTQTENIGVTLDSVGDLFASNDHNTIYKVPAGSTTGAVFASSGLSTPFSLAINPAGTALYVANADGNSIVSFPLAGGAGTTFATTGLSTPIGLVFDTAGNLYVGNRTTGTIERFDPSGNASVFATGLGDVEFLAFGPVPEPSTWALLGVGTVGAGIVTLRRRRA